MTPVPCTFRVPQDHRRVWPEEGSRLFSEAACGGVSSWPPLCGHLLLGASQALGVMTAPLPNQAPVLVSSSPSPSPSASPSLEGGRTKGWPQTRAGGVGGQRLEEGPQPCHCLPLHAPHSPFSRPKIAPPAPPLAPLEMPKLWVSGAGRSPDPPKPGQGG